MSEQDQESEIRNTALQLVDDLLSKHWARVVSNREENAKKRTGISLNVTVCTLGSKPTVKVKISGGAKWKDEEEDKVTDQGELGIGGEE